MRRFLSIPSSYANPIEIFVSCRFAIYCHQIRNFEGLLVWRLDVFSTMMPGFSFPPSGAVSLISGVHTHLKRRRDSGKYCSVDFFLVYLCSRILFLLVFFSKKKSCPSPDDRPIDVLELQGTKKMGGSFFFFLFFFFLRAVRHTGSFSCLILL